MGDKMEQQGNVDTGETELKEFCIIVKSGRVEVVRVIFLFNFLRHVESVECRVIAGHFWAPNSVTLSRWIPEILSQLPTGR